MTRRHYTHLLSEKLEETIDEKLPSFGYLSPPVLAVGHMLLRRCHGNMRTSARSREMDSAIRTHGGHAREELDRFAEQYPLELRLFCPDGGGGIGNRWRGLRAKLLRQQTASRFTSRAIHVCGRRRGRWHFGSAQRQ